MSEASPAYYRPGSYRPEDSVAYLMRRIVVALAAEVERELEPCGLTHAQWIPMFKLLKGQASTPAELARECQLDAGSMTRTLDRLEAKGFIQRVRSQADRRVVNIELTEEGLRTAEQIPQVLCRVQNGHLRGFEPAELEHLKQLLTRVLANASASAAAASASADAVRALGAPEVAS